MPRFGPYKFEYSPPITLYFDSDVHRYVIETPDALVEVPGVTTMLRIIDKSEYLVPWSAKKTSEKLKATMPTESDGLDDFTQRIPVEEFYSLCDAAKKAHKEILEDAGDVGEQAHRALEDAIKFAIQTNQGTVKHQVYLPPDLRAQSCCIAALDWMKKHNVRWTHTERKIYSREYGFAGTLDGVGTVDSCTDPKCRCCTVPFKDIPAIIDWKSANQMSITFAYQCCAYKHAYQEETGVRIPDCWILRLGKEDGKFEPRRITEKEYGTYLAAFLGSMDLTADHGAAKALWSQESKDATVRKRAAAKQVKEDEKVAAKEAKAVLKAEKKKVVV